MIALDAWGEDLVLEAFRMIGIDPAVTQSWAVHPDRICRRNRHQVITTFPIFAALLVRFPLVPIHMEIEAAIDRGDPLIEVLSSILGLSKRTIRFLRGKALELIGPAWMEHPSELFAAVEMIPPEKLPRNPTDWKHFRVFWEGCGEWHGSRCCVRPIGSSRKPPAMVMHMFTGLCAPGYERSAMRLSLLWRGNLQRLSDVKDYFQFVARWCGAGAGIRESSVWSRNAAETLRDALLTRYSAMELVRQSERWHCEVSQIPAVEPDSEVDGVIEEWPALPGLPLQVGELTVVALTNHFELRMEGSRMNHCVGVYFQSCMYGDSHIVSIRNGDDESLSTAEISLITNASGELLPNVVQHKAHSDEEPDHECNTALAATLEMLRGGSVQSRLQQINGFHVERREKVSALLEIEDGGYPVAVMSEVMSKVLRDYGDALRSLVGHLDQGHAFVQVAGCVSSSEPGRNHSASNATQVVAISS